MYAVVRPSVPMHLRMRSSGGGRVQGSTWAARAGIFEKAPIEEHAVATTMGVRSFPCLPAWHRRRGVAAHAAAARTARNALSRQ